MAEIISIRRMRRNNDPDVFINTVLNDPARIARIKEEQYQAKKKAEADKRIKEQKAKNKEAMKNFALSLAVGVSFFATFISLCVVFLL